MLFLDEDMMNNRVISDGELTGMRLKQKKPQIIGAPFKQTMKLKSKKKEKKR